MGLGKVGGSVGGSDARGDRWPAQPDDRCGQGIDLVRLLRADAIGRLLGPPDPPARATAIVETPPAPELDG